MNDLLFEYMNRRVSGDPLLNLKPIAFGPVITISRQTGCGAESIAHELCVELNKQKLLGNKHNEWKYISKEILQRTAEELNLDPNFLHHVIADKNRGIMDQIVEALSTHAHKSDQKILKTIQAVIRQFACKGNAVIIGRGGARICSDIRRSVHIRLEAPEEWRIDALAKKMDFSKDFAAEYVRSHDAQRELFKTKVYGKSLSNLLYDVVINRSRFTEKEIVEIIIQLGKTKGIF